MSNLLKYMSELPVKTAEFAKKIPMMAPANATDPFKATITMKNLEIASVNAERDAKWQELLRSKNDTAAAMLVAALRPKADMGIKAHVAAHAYPPPYSEQLNGGAIFRAIKLLKAGRAS